MAEAKVEGPMRQLLNKLTPSGDGGGSQAPTTRPLFKLPALLRWMILLLLLSLPGPILAEPELQLFKADMTNVTQEAVEKADRKAKMLLYFSAVDGITGDPLPVVDGEGKPVTKVKLERDKAEVETHVTSMSLKDFKDGDVTVAVMVVFPNALIHEGLIGPILADKFFSQLRDKDEVGAIGYGDDIPQSVVLRLGKGNAKTYKNAISTVAPTNDNQVRPNVYVAIQSAAAELKSSKADLKYLIVISDGQGRTTADAKTDFDEAMNSVQVQDLRPFVIMYPPEPKMAGAAGKAEVIVKQLQSKGYFTKADSKPAFEKALERAAAHVYGQHHILEVIYDLKEEWIDPGKLKIELTAALDGGAQTRSINAEWPKLAKSYMWILWLVLGILGFALLLFAIWRIIVWRRNRPQPEPEAAPVYVEDAPQDVYCEVCGKRVPETLYGFSGEFCLDKGKTGCPYYQSPDKGRLMITKGELSGTMFFIKEEITTVGSLVSEDTLVLLREPTVSKKHAAIRVDEGNRYELRDFSSTNGTRVNGEFIQRKFLKDGDRLHFGEVEVEFTLK
jgi:hypothetical protein